MVPISSFDKEIALYCLFSDIRVTLSEFGICIVRENFEFPNKNIFAQIDNSQPPMMLVVSRNFRKMEVHRIKITILA